MSYENNTDKLETFLKESRPKAPKAPKEELSRIQKQMNLRKKARYIRWAIPALATMLIIIFLAQTQLINNTKNLTANQTIAVNEILDEAWGVVYEQDNWEEDIAI